MLVLHIARGAQLSRAVASLLCVAPQPPLAAAMFSPEGMSLQISDPNGIVSVVLGFDDSDFCCSVYGSAWVNLAAFDCIIASALDEDGITITTSAWGKALRFTLENFVTPKVKQLGSVDFIARIPNKNDIKSRCRYDVVIGMPSQTFRQILMTLVNEFEALSVSVSVSSGKVAISSDNGKIELTKENGDCIILGAEGEENPAQLPIGSSSIRTSMLEASELCPSVWLFKSSLDDSPNMLNFPVPTIGNLKYYFVQRCDDCKDC